MGEAISRLTALGRTLRPLRVIADRRLRGPFGRDQLLAAVEGVRLEVRASRHLGARSVGLWRLEKLGFEYTRDPAVSLDDPAIPPAVQPILHVGLGVAATEAVGFDATAVAARIERQAHPAYRQFPYESIGCIWAVYSSWFYQRLFRLVSRVTIPAHTLPPYASLTAALPPEVARLLAHGYGRTLYFARCSTRGALRAARRVTGLDLAAAAQGVAFATAMLNHADLGRVLGVVPCRGPGQPEDGYRLGQAYALAFWEWAFPGTLDEVCGPLPAAPLTGAREVLAASRAAGRLMVFGVD